MSLFTVHSGRGCFFSKVGPRIVARALLVGLILLSGKANLQEPPLPPGEKQSVEVTKVTITQVDACTTGECRQVQAVVDVSDADNQSVHFPEPLEEHFSICERLEGDECGVTDFEVTKIGTEEPITVGIVFDHSSSMNEPGTTDQPKLEEARAAATAFLNELREQDVAAVLPFSADCSAFGEFTDDKDQLLQEVENIPRSEGTALYRCTCEAIDLIVPEPGSVKALVVFTDGLDTRSALCPTCCQTWQAVSEAANVRSIPCYTIAFGPDADQVGLSALAEATGGQYEFAPGGEEIKEIFLDILARLRAQYVVDYCSPCFTGLGGETELEICAGDQPVSCLPDQVCGQATFVLRAPPQIERTPETIQLSETTQETGQPLQICAWITASAPVEEARIYLRRTGETSYGSGRAMQHVEGDLWCYEIPGEDLQQPGVDYYITAFDGLCSSTDPGIDPRDNPYQIPASEPLTCSHESPSEFCPGYPLAVDVSVAVRGEERFVQMVMVSYRRVGGINFDSQLLQQESDAEIWKGEIPGGSVGDQGVEYAIRACDNFGLCCSAGTVDDPIVVGLDKKLCFLRCDANDDGWMDISDPVWLIYDLFLSGPRTPCMRAADCNADGAIDLSDAIYGIEFQLKGGPRPPAPFPGCGSAGLSELGCEQSRCNQ